MLFVTDYVTGLTRDSISAPAERMLCTLNDVLLQLINAFLYSRRSNKSYLLVVSNMYAFLELCSLRMKHRDARIGPKASN